MITFLIILNFFCKLFEVNMQIVSVVLKKHSLLTESFSIYLEEKLVVILQNLIQERP